jgi:hypothetical protein
MSLEQACGSGANNGFEKPRPRSSLGFYSQGPELGLQSVVVLTLLVGLLQGLFFQLAFLVGLLLGLFFQLAYLAGCDAGLVQSTLQFRRQRHQLTLRIRQP